MEKKENQGGKREGRRNERSATEESRRESKQSSRGNTVELMEEITESRCLHTKNHIYVSIQEGLFGAEHPTSTSI